ncbi:AraC family transcriptional regulator [Sphingomonas sp. S2-65]|uniref:AraC family transcriptional regulator n=1 Tax=Sphingomonas sp. S2-65 TaxID=2903960 RepID=UPI001F28F290|nr:AraC family transcriptional regulator [Sphingomonas sp. S2-65]UYY58403.1 AraC family transcriptional regulator [Sphingomonas sp. S2-65]
MRTPTRLREFDDGNDRWHMVDVAPAEHLRDAISGYGWWSESTTSFDTRRELAGTRGTLIVNLASDLDLVDAQGNAVRLRAGEGFIAGLAQATSLSRSTGAMAGVHVQAPLATLARLAGTSIADLTDRIVPLSDLPAFDMLRLGDKLLDVVDAEARWTLLDTLIGDRLAAAADPSPAIAHIARRLRAGARVEAIATELGWSRKRLAETFKQATGLEPRTYAGLARFERFAARLQAGPALPLAQAAVAAGYADQPHLTREVARYASMTPAALRRHLLPDGGGVRE